MCVERVQRVFTAFVVLLASFLILKGYVAGVYLLWFVATMLVVWGVTNFCPSFSFFRWLGLKPCQYKR
ncbi:MAG: DUF2892 domain-containing protein [bacterium]|nr:DUF2892 domain-containing protein [bacterium]